MRNIDLTKWTKVNERWYYRVVADNFEVHVSAATLGVFEVSFKNNELHQKVPEYFESFETAIEEGDKLFDKLSAWKLGNK